MHSIQLKNVPDDLYEFILKRQFEAKTKKMVGFYSQEKTILKIIEDYKNLIEKSKN